MNYTKEQTETDKALYNLANSYLLQFDAVTPQILERQLLHTMYDRPQNLSDIYRRLVYSAQNRGMLPNVIKSAIRDLDRLGTLLGGFQPYEVIGKYGDSWERLIDDIETQISTRKIRKTSSSIWPQFCRAILSGARFMSQFHTAEDFCGFVDFFDRDERARVSLPMLLDHEIDGFGFALSCDFLKELGYQNFGKPDTHVKKIFGALNLSASEKDYDVFKAIVRVARNVGVKPFTVDKLFCLIGSGNFYSSDLRIGRHRDESIDYAKKHLAKRSSLPY